MAYKLKKNFRWKGVTYEKGSVIASLPDGAKDYPNFDGVFEKTTEKSS